MRGHCLQLGSEMCNLYAGGLIKLAIFTDNRNSGNFQLMRRMAILKRQN